MSPHKKEHQFEEVDYKDFEGVESHDNEFRQAFDELIKLSYYESKKVGGRVQKKHARKKSASKFDFNAFNNESHNTGEGREFLAELGPSHFENLGMLIDDSDFV